MGARIARAAAELSLLLRSGATRDIASNHWDGSQHQFDGNATRASKDISGADFSSDLTRLAAGGTP